MRNNDTTKQQTKLTMVSVFNSQFRKTIFIDLPVEADGKVRCDYNLVLHAAGMHFDRGVTICIG